ncbi:branched-chain amino acid ABC transporter permease [Aureimonas fodinaquatilis]|uniref:Branched-chain amino acid ABC transporter permease n=1 Tax=Aureimonas fodinaquatilis TaxID=2565783 RepID=A0A5B0DY59_9HYPH|nr:branched-chain amino acid ABC transporter permease [Aureimonas fodinaquatilis]KAA0971757.1 branched-chain amino acid ABC transporter permease [Aureimonas fodinaquatilis]
MTQIQRNRLAFVAFALVYLCIIPVLLSGAPYMLGILSMSAALSVIAMGVWVTFTIGRINLGQAAFALVGGFTAAILTTRFGLSFWIALPAAGLVSALVGVVLGLGILRLRGVYFAMITLSLSETMRLALLNGGELTGGATGITSIPVPGELSFFGLVIIPDFASVNSHLAYYFLSATLLLLSIALVWRLMNSRLGRVFASLQQGQELSQSLGINITKYRLIAFAVSCFLGGIGGAFFAASQQSIYPGSFVVSDSISFTLYCFLGGLAFVAGPVVGAFLLTLSFQFLHGLQQYQQLAYALIMIGIMMWLPNGLLSLRLPGFRRRSANPVSGETGNVR